MLETGSPPEDEREEVRSAVLPLSSHSTSRSSSPGLSLFDGTPLYLFPFSIPPYPSRSTSPPRDMAIKTVCHPDVDRQERPPSRKPSQRRNNGKPVTPNRSTRGSSTAQDGLSDAVTEHPISLSDLTRISQLEGYQSRKCRQIQQHLYSVSIVAARTARLAHTARSVQRTLAECIKSEDKQGFINLFNAFSDSLSECYEPPKSLDEKAQGQKEGSHGYPPSFLDNLSADSRTKLLEFLTRTRHDSKFVADRLAVLSHKDLIALLPGNGPGRSDASIFGSSPRSSFRSSRHLGFVVDGQTELLSSSEMCSPLETLVHCLRPIPVGPLEDDEATTDIWANVCARLLSEQKPGSEKLVPAVLDIWASSSAWPGKERLEGWLLKVLQQGSSILEQTQKQSFRVRLQARQEPAQAEDHRLEDFFAEAVKSLLDLLVDQDGADLIPAGVQKLCSTIHSKLHYSPRHQMVFPNFMITRWLFSTFLLDAITLPEMHGMLSDYFVSDNVRHRILREIASRCQKAVFDVVYPWKYGGSISEHALQVVAKLADLLHGTRRSKPEVDVDFNSRTNDSTIRNSSFVILSAADLTTLVGALYPPKRPASLSERDASYSGVQSSASSISGFSLFQNIGTLDQSGGLYVNSVTANGPRAYEHNAADSISASNNQPELDADAVHSELDGFRLREACIAIDDFLNSRRPATVDKWCILLADPLTKDFCTVHHALYTSKSDQHHIADNRQFSAGQKTCKAVLEELLNDGDLAHSSAPSTRPEEQAQVLLNQVEGALKQRMKQLKDTADFAAAHSYSRRLRHLRELCDAGRSPYNLVLLTLGLEHEKKESLLAASDTIESCDILLRSLAPSVESQSSQLLAFADTTARLRHKMWYVADVRTSAPYDEARAITSALRSMGKIQPLPRTRPTPSSRTWAGVKASSTPHQAKTDAQVFDLLSAPAGYGGKSKLSDDQSKALATWMERNTIENFCGGEERLHKLCMEIRKAVDQLTAEGSSFRSSALLARDASRPAFTQFSKPRNFLWTLHEDRKRFDMLALHTDVKGPDNVSNGSSHPLSARSSRDRLDSWSPSMTNRSSATFWSPVTTEARSPSSVTSVGSSQTQSAPHHSTSKHVQDLSLVGSSSVEQLRKHLTSLLLSDLATSLFADGSETDRSFWSGLGGELTARYVRNLCPVKAVMPSNEPAEEVDFDFPAAFEALTIRFSTTCDPHTKLRRLLDIDTLLPPYMAGLTSHSGSGPAISTHSARQNGFKRQMSSTGGDARVQGFMRLFCADSTRPRAIFRDLQYIAALVPSSILESTPQGKAFWNAAAAISNIKRGVCNVMVETADSIIAHHSNNRGHGRSSSVAQRERDSAAFSVPNPSPSPEDIGGRTMADAALLLQITAKEGYPVAQRELATLYLTDPELMDHIIAPFSRPREVFKEELESKWKKNQDPTRCDPTTMCVAHHWMSLSSKGGDALATEFLRQREEMERLP